jgi:hypothetical protein
LPRSASHASPPRTPATRALPGWLDNWSGIGLVVVGMDRQGYQFSLRKYGNGDGAWVAQFNLYVAASADGFGTAAIPWTATQQAAWAAVERAAI